MDPDEALRKYEAARASGDKQGAYDAAEALYGWLDRGGFEPRGYTQKKHAEVVAFYRKNRALGRARGKKARGKTASLSDLTPDQQDALLAYARENGAKWKSKLNADWLRAAARIGGQHSAELQQIRNSFGPAWLHAVQIDTGRGMARGAATALGRASGFKRTAARHIPGKGGYTVCGERAVAKNLGSPGETTCYYCAHFWAKEHGGGTLVGGKGRAGGIKEARASATLDKQIRLSPEATRELGTSGTVVSRRELIQRARAIGATLKEASVRREAAEKKLREDIERASRGWSIPIGNPHHPDTIKHNEKIARLKAGIFEVEYRLFVPSGTFFVITKTEADYFTSLAEPGAVTGRAKKGRSGKKSVHPPSCRCSSCSLFVRGKKGRSGGSNAGAMTPEAVAHALREHLAPILGSRVWRVNGPTAISPSVHVVFANVPRGASELDALNAGKNAMISVSSTEWDRGSSAARAAQGPVRITASGPARYETPPASLVTASQFSGRGMRMRKKSGTPAQVIAHVVKFFKEHA